MKNMQLDKSKNDKIRVAIFPNMHFEVAIGTFLNKNKYKIIPLTVIDHKATSNYAQKLHGEWCFPIKLHVAMYEKAIVEQNVKHIFSLNINVCSYPIIMLKLHNSIKQKFSFYPIITKKPCMSFSIIYQTYKQFKKLDSNYSIFKFIKKFPVAYWKMNNISRLFNIYSENLPKVKNPELYKKKFLFYKNKFINCDNIKKLKSIIMEFNNKTKKYIYRNKYKYKLLLTGDLAVMTTEFSLFDIDIFLAKNKIKIINKFNTSDFCFIIKILNIHKKAKRIFSNLLSSENKKSNVDRNHLVELYSLAEVTKAVDEGIDGVVFVKPNMCKPSEHVSYILKQNNYFNLPFVELTYDEHSGLNGIITRLEAFINILKDKEKNVQ